MVLTPAPTKLPCLTSKGAMFTWICSIAESEIGATPVRSPGVPASPNELLKYEPSTVMLFSRLSWPANDMPPPDWGVSRVTEDIDWEIVGSVARVSRLSVVAAPVLFEPNTGSEVPTTVTSSEAVTAFRLSTRSVATPRFRNTPSSVWGWNPCSSALTVYGPPTLMP